MLTVKIKEKELPVQEYLIQELADQIEKIKNTPGINNDVKELALAMAKIANIT